MAISRCNEIVIARKKFSEFEYYSPMTKEDTENLYLAGYIEDELGNKQNVKLKASTFINSSLGNVIGSLNPDRPADSGELITIVNEKVQGKTVRVTTINYDNTNFVQINDIDDTMFSIHENKDYLFIRLSENMPLGTVIRFYLPNFKKNKGVMLLPTSSGEEVKEIFFNDDFGGVTQAQSDYYFTIIQLADPVGGKVTTRSKVIEVNNITGE